jgi:hypothetical protein
VGVATLVGTGFGTQVKLSGVLSGIDALLDGQELYLSGWMFNCAGTTVAAQSAAVKSAKIRRSISPGSARNAVKSAWLEPWPNALAGGEPVTYTPVVSLNAFWQLATADGTGSLKLQLDEDATPYGTTKVNAPDQSDHVLVLVQAGISSVYTLTVTPYTEADYGGVAGTPVVYEFTLNLASELTDQDGGQVVAPLALEQTGAGALRGDVDPATGILVLNVDVERLTPIADPVDGAADLLLIYDDSAQENRSVPVGDLVVGAGMEELTAGDGIDMATPYDGTAPETIAVDTTIPRKAGTEEIDGDWDFSGTLKIPVI